MDHIEDDEDEYLPDDRDPDVALRFDSSESRADGPKISELRREIVLGATNMRSLGLDALWLGNADEWIDRCDSMDGTDIARRY
ncbi:hypothetical protein PRIC1_014127 [Phytophthora ramorum]